MQSDFVQSTSKVLKRARQINDQLSRTFVTGRSLNEDIKG